MNIACQDVENPVPTGSGAVPKSSEVIMSTKISMIFLVAAVMLLSCKQQGASVSGASAAPSANADPNDAIRTVIQARIAHNGNLNLQSFDTEVKQITIDGAHARAQVEFHAKNGPGAMQFTYALEKRDGAWFVVESNPGGGNFAHPALDGSQTPSQMGTGGANSSVFQTLDKLHGRTAANSQNLPPGHPPIAASPQNASPQAP
jgi:hypothetical protein